MESVQIYILTSVKGPAKRNGIGMFVLALKKNAMPGTVEIENSAENTANIVTLIEALKHMIRKSHLVIYTDVDYIPAAYKNGWVENWKKNGWKNSKGKQVSEKWIELDELLKKHTFEFRTKEKHQFYSWMKTEIERRI